MDYFVISCPHCQEPIIIYKKELNCHIFRHGVYRENLKQIDPHLKKEECDRLSSKSEIYGCGKPFQIVEHKNTYQPIMCDYS